MTGQESSSRRLPITQIDELWSVAKERWGDPGRRTPAPDKRFNELRDLLGRVEKLFGQDKIEVKKTDSLGIRRRKFAPIADVDFDPTEDEIPF